MCIFGNSSARWRKADRGAGRTFCLHSNNERNCLYVDDTVMGPRREPNPDEGCKQLVHDVRSCESGAD